MIRKGFSLRLGIRPYDAMLELQRKINAARRMNAVADTVIFLEHDPCITVGAQGKRSGIIASPDLLNQHGIKIYETDRGGDLTYHGPGQVVCYPIIDLHHYGCDVTTYARTLEEVVIKTLNAFDVPAVRKKGYPGVWVDDRRKISAQGISVDRWITMHGVSINVNPAMEHFRLMIIPCGLREYDVVSMAEYLGKDVDIQAVFSEMIGQFSALFNIRLETIEERDIVELIDHAQEQAS